MLQGDPEVDPTWTPGPEPTFNINEDPEVAGQGITLPGASTDPAREPDSALDSPIAGTGPASNPVGSDADPDTPGLQGPGSTRVTPDGVVQQGRDLSLRLPTAEEILAYTGRELANPFASNTIFNAKRIFSLLQSVVTIKAHQSLGGAIVR